MSNNVAIPLEVLSYWYESAKTGIERYDPDVKCSDPLLQESREKRYKMAVKTVAVLKDLFETPIETEIITEDKENKNNE